MMKDLLDDKEYEKYLDREVIVLISDYRYLSGIFRSFNQFNAITLEDTTERIFSLNEFSEKYHGLLTMKASCVFMITIGKQDLSGFEKVTYNLLKNKIDLKYEKENKI